MVDATIQAFLGFFKPTMGGVPRLHTPQITKKKKERKPPSHYPDLVTLRGLM